MPLDNLKTWVSGEELAAADLNKNFSELKQAFEDFEKVGLHVKDVIVTSGSYTLTADDSMKLIIMNASGTTLTLPLASTLTFRRAFIVSTNFSTGTITVSGGGSIVRYLGSSGTSVSVSYYHNVIFIAIPSRNEYVGF